MSYKSPLQQILDRPLLILLLVLLVVGISIFVLSHKKTYAVKTFNSNEAEATSTFQYSFNSIGTLEEAVDAQHSTSPYWWIDSGGQMIIKNGYGSTNFGNISKDSVWYNLYLAHDPADTDQGKHPQNLFRLITKSSWQNFSQEASFYIDKYNLSESTNRSESNGLLLFNHYVDENNLYYAGVRVDGFAVIKKKQNGIYTTLIQNQVFKGNYDRDKHPNLLPTHKWLSLRTVTTNQTEGVKIELYYKEGKSDWQKLLETVDIDHPITAKAHAGIRTDFMDVKFENYRINILNP